MAEERRGYKITTPTTGAYTVKPMANPISTYVRPQALDPKYAMERERVKAFQGFMDNLATWRLSENEDSQDKAQLRVMADSAKGILNENLPHEDEYYKKFGRLQQGKDYGKKVGAQLLVDVVQGTKDEQSLLDQAIALKRKPGEKRNLEELFGSLLEETKESYRDQINEKYPEASDEFYAGFGESMQPFKDQINAQFFERVQTETINERRTSFSKAVTPRIEHFISLRLDNAESLNKGQKDFRPVHIRALVDDYADEAGLTQDQATSEVLDIWTQEALVGIANAKTDEEMAVYNDMLSVFDETDDLKGSSKEILGKWSQRQGLRFLSIEQFKVQSTQSYNNIFKALKARENQIDREEKEEKIENREKARSEVARRYLDPNNTKKTDLFSISKEFPDATMEDLSAMRSFEGAEKAKNAQITTDPNLFGDLLIKSRNGELRDEDIIKELKDSAEKGEGITLANASTLLTNSDKARKFDSGTLKNFSDEVVRSLERIPQGYDWKMLLSVNPEAHDGLQDSLLELQENISFRLFKKLNESTGEAINDPEVRRKILDEVYEEVKPQREAYNKLVEKTFGDIKKIEEKEDTKDPEEFSYRDIKFKLPDGTEFKVKREFQRRYLEDEEGWETLYEDYYSYARKIRGDKGASVPYQSIFWPLVYSGNVKTKQLKDLKQLRGEGVEIIKQLQKQGELKGRISFKQWVTKQITKDYTSSWWVNKSTEKAFRSLWENLHRDGAPFPEKKSSIRQTGGRIGILRNQQK